MITVPLSVTVVVTVSVTGVIARNLFDRLDDPDPDVRATALNSLVTLPVPEDVDPVYWTPGIADIGAYQQADLILLKENPLEDIEHALRIEYVIQGTRVHHTNTLAEKVGCTNCLQPN